MSFKVIAIAAGLVLAVPCASHAQKIEWTETLKLPKGMNMPADVKADILGIELGATYDDAKAALDRLLAEAPPPPQPHQTQEQRSYDLLRGVVNELAVREVTTTMTLPVANGPAIQASYVGAMILKRDLPGSTDRKIREEINVSLSAPSSGHQVIAVTRSIFYPVQGDQPRISELVQALEEKFKGAPTVVKKPDPNSSYQKAVYSFVFAKGALDTHSVSTETTCANNGWLGSTASESSLAYINPKRQCDVLMQVTAFYGISNDHAARLDFSLVDSERAKETATADYAFFNGYMEKAQKRSGAAPKL